MLFREAPKQRCDDSENLLCLRPDASQICKPRKLETVRIWYRQVQPIRYKGLFSHQCSHFRLSIARFSRSESWAVKAVFQICDLWFPRWKQSWATVHSTKTDWACLYYSCHWSLRPLSTDQNQEMALFVEIWKAAKREATVPHVLVLIRLKRCHPREERVE